MGHKVIVSVLGAAATLAVGAWGANDYLRSTYAGKLELAQTAESIQAGVKANQLQLMRWELSDILKRLGTPQELPGDQARRIELEARIKALAGQ